MTDAHCHPKDLLSYQKNAEYERRKAGVVCAASSWNLEEFEYHEKLKTAAVSEGAPAVFCCFALHPQLFCRFDKTSEKRSRLLLPAANPEVLYALAARGRLDAVGETGFDLYEEKHKAAEKIQDEMFACHMETALKYSLPLVLHLRRAMHKIFPFSKDLKKLPAVVFHSWPGTKGEGEALLRRGINAFFSFGTGILNNHRGMMASASSFPLDRLLVETDAPYQPVQGNSFSSWNDLEKICRGISALRKEAGSHGQEEKEIEDAAYINFFRAFSRRQAR